jgi:hypothetical protein
MTTFGLTPTGFVPKTYEDLITEAKSNIQSIYGLSFNLINGIAYRYTAVMMERIAELWEILQAIVSSQDPDGGTGVGLEGIAAITGTLKLKATQSRVVLSLTGAPATLVETGARAKAASTGSFWVTDEDGTIAAVPAWAGGTLYAAGDRRTNAGRVYICTLGGTSGISPLLPPTTATDADITIDVPHWRFIGEGTGVIDVDAVSKDTGPVIGVSGDITVRDTAVFGWNGVKNLADAALGRNIETDAELRVRREQELSQAGTTVPDAIRADLLELEDSTETKIVQSATVFYNDSDVTDSDGVPPHSVECLVRLPVGADFDQLVYNQLFASVAAGIRTHGTSVGTVVDSEGTSHTIKFTRPQEITIYVDLTFTKDPRTYPANGNAQVQAAVVDYGNAQLGGVDAVASRIGAQAFKVTGVLDVPRSGSLGGCLIKTSAGPTSDATIAISTRQLAVYDTSRITLHTSDATP